MTDFRHVARELAPRGGWLRDDTSQAWLSGLGGAVSTSLGLWRESVKARFASTAPADALVVIGDTRQLERAPLELEADHRVRLTRAFEIHALGGTKGIYPELLSVLGVSAANVIAWDDWEASGIPAPPGTDPWWSRAWVVVNSSAGPWTGPLWYDDGSDLWGDSDGGIWAVDGLTIDELQWLRREVRKRKWAGAPLIAMFVILAGDVWGDGSTWSDPIPDAWSDAGGDVVVLQFAHVWGGEEAFYGAPAPSWLDDGSDTWESLYDFGD